MQPRALERELVWAAAEAHSLTHAGACLGGDTGEVVDALTGAGVSGGKGALVDAGMGADVSGGIGALVDARTGVGEGSFPRSCMDVPNDP